MLLVIGLQSGVQVNRSFAELGRQKILNKYLSMNPGECLARLYFMFCSGRPRFWQAAGFNDGSPFAALVAE